MFLLSTLHYLYPSLAISHSNNTSLSISLFLSPSLAISHSDYISLLCISLLCISLFLSISFHLSLFVSLSFYLSLLFGSFSFFEQYYSKNLYCQKTLCLFIQVIFLTAYLSHMFNFCNSPFIFFLNNYLLSVSLIIFKTVYIHIHKYFFLSGKLHLLNCCRYE